MHDIWGLQIACNFYPSLSYLQQLTYQYDNPHQQVINISNNTYTSYMTTQDTSLTQITSTNNNTNKKQDSEQSAQMGKRNTESQVEASIYVDETSCGGKKQG